MTYYKTIYQHPDGHEITVGQGLLNAQPRALPFAYRLAEVLKR